MLFRLSILAALALTAFLAVTSARLADAEGEASAPALVSQTCTPGFTVEVVLGWTPSGAGQQWIDVSQNNDGFSTPYLPGGPFDALHSEATVSNLEPQRNYYVRVNTWNGSEWAPSELFAFTTGCELYEATGPTHVAGASISDTAARFSWNPGNGNLWYCVDYANSPEELISQTGSWGNSGCGTTDTAHVVQDMHCGQTYYARIWAWTTQGGRYSGQTQLTTQPCATTITPPTGLHPVFAAPHLTRLAWTPGDDNIWYCVDLATDVKDLVTFSGTWQNHCGLTEPELELDRLKCDTQYIWRVFTWNYNVNAHSAVRSFFTGDCDLDDRIARVDDVQVYKSTDGVYRAEVLVYLPDGCHQPGQYEIVRVGDRFEITVENLYRTPLTVCSFSTGTHLWTIRLGGDFASGSTYEVVVNGQRNLFFTAR